MSKRRRKLKRRKSVEPTLFDLPLRAGDAGEPEAASPAEEAAGPAVGQGPSILFDVDERGTTENGAEGAGDEIQPVRQASLDGVELAAGGSVPAEPVDEPQVEVSGTLMPDHETPRSAAREDDRAYVGDRLLGGLADLAAQLIALGLAIAATHAMDIVVTVDDWMPFGLLALVFSFLYWVVPLAFWGQTPGMAWVGHAARSSSGEPLTFGQTFLRWLGSLVTLAFAGLPLLIALSGRSLTDRISDSRTIAR